MNILLLNPPYILDKDSPYSKTGAVLPPLGLLYIGAYLKAFHPLHAVSVIDAPAYKLTVNDLESRLRGLPAPPDVIGITVYTATLPFIIETVKKIRAVLPRAILVAGGPHASILPEECISLGDFDIAVRGEGEKVFGELVECIAANKEFSGVPNLVYKKNGTLARTEAAYSPLDVNTIPFPARDLVDMRLYRPAQGTYKRLPSINMLTSRGCPFRCPYCSKSIFGSNYRAQSVERTVEEIEMLIKTYGMREILFNDDVFTFDQRRIDKLCGLLIQKKLDVTWSCSTRINLVTPALLKKMKLSGCVSIGYGIESGSPEILESISKGLSIAQTREAIKWTSEAGIETRAFYIFGLPGETRKTLEETLKAAIELNTDFVIFNLAIPLPGTSMFEAATKQKLLLYEGLELYRKADGPHPLIRLEDMDEEALKAFYKDAYKKYYLRLPYMFKRLRGISSMEELGRNLSGFFSFLSWFK